MAKNANAAMFAVIAQAEGELQRSMLANLASVRKVDIEVLTKEFGEFAEANAAKVEKDRKRAEREARMKRVEALVKEGEGITLTSDSLGDFVTRVETEGGLVAINPDLTIRVAVKLPKVHKGGGGKPAKDAPQPYVDSEGERILGPLTTWAKDNFSDEELHEKGAYRPNGKFRTGASLAKALIKAEVISASPVPSDDTDTE